MPRATMEFESIRAMNDHRHNHVRPTSAGNAEPWVPGGPKKSHNVKARGIPTKREEVAVAAARVEEATMIRDSVLTRLESAEIAFDRLEDTLDAVLEEYQQHVVTASAASVLLQKRLRELGV